MSNVFTGDVLCIEVYCQLKVWSRSSDARLSDGQVIAIPLDADELMPELDGGYSGSARSHKRVEDDVGGVRRNAIDEFTHEWERLGTRVL